MAVQLTAQRRWVMTGTPTPSTSSGARLRCVVARGLQLQSCGSEVGDGAHVWQLCFVVPRGGVRMPHMHACMGIATALWRRALQGPTAGANKAPCQCWGNVQTVAWLGSLDGGQNGVLYMRMQALALRTCSPCWRSCITSRLDPASKPRKGGKPTHTCSCGNHERMPLHTAGGRHVELGRLCEPSMAC